MTAEPRELNEANSARACIYTSHPIPSLVLLYSIFRIPIPYFVSPGGSLLRRRCGGALLDDTKNGCVGDYPGGSNYHSGTERDRFHRTDSWSQT